MLIDTHAHLDFPEFAGDLDAVLARAAENGVGRIISISTDLESTGRVLALAARYRQVCATAGIHPNHVRIDQPDFLAELRQLASRPEVVAIGEIGLDYHYLPSRTEKEDIVRSALGAASLGSVELEIQDEALKAAQAAAFEQQLELAEELDKPVVIHQRDAWDDTLAIVRKHAVRAVFHCFSGNAAQAGEVLDLGHLVSFTGIVTFKNAAEVKRTAAALPLDRFMVETDAPFLAPVPFRGKRCEPAFVRRTAEAIARARGIGIDRLAEQTTATARAFFGLNDSVSRG
ncbi:MAG: TatD family hydrolase [Verrucomicrobia bacterium]|nr:TatD family hydrolase [Verrucomicrobiota bacterium]